MSAADSVGKELPDTKTMLDDLSRVEGLDFFWQTLAMAFSIGVLTDEEGAIVQRMTKGADDGR